MEGFLGDPCPCSRVKGWFAVALNQAAEFPDEPERWPVKMLLPFDPLALKRTFHSLALELMSRVTSGGSTE
jgi:hypothetical protein